MPSDGRPRLFLGLYPNVGDVVCFTPLLRWIRRTYPDAYVVASTSKLAADLVTSNPNVDEVWLRPGKGLSERIQFVQRMRQARFDTAVTAYGHHRTILQTILAGVPKRIAVGGEKYGRWYTKLTVPDDRPMIAESVRVIARALDLRPDTLGLELHLSDAVHAGAEAHLRRVGIDPAQPFVAMQTGASHPNKLWPIERFREVWSSLDVPTVLIGGPGDVARDREATAGQNQPAVLTGELKLLETAAVLSRAALMVTNDSGPMHLGVAAGTRVVALFGPTDAFHYLPQGDPNYPQYSAGHRWFQGECGCPLRRVETCARACWQSIPAQDVAEAARQMLQA